MKRIAQIAVSALALLIAAPVQAELMLMISFTPDGTPGEFQVKIDETLDIPVYVFQYGDTQILSESGLFSAGVMVTADSTARAELTNAVLAAHWTGEFNLAEYNSETGIAQLEGSIGLNGGGEWDYVFPDENSNAILIGIVTFKGTTLGQTILTSSDPDEFFANVVAGDDEFTELDAFVFANPTQATIVTIPEPNTFVLIVLGIIAMASVRGARRRRDASIL